MEPELENQRAFHAEHPFQTLRAIDGHFQIGLFGTAVDAIFEHLAIPIAEEDAGLALRWQTSPIAPGRRMREFFIGGHVEAVDANQPRVHPFTEQFDRLALAGALDAVDQDQQRKTRLLAQPVLRVQQGLAQGRHLDVIGCLVDGVADFRGFEHGVLQNSDSAATASGPHN